ncbi:MAG: PAS domain-containing protein [Candidatus Electrothrix sp. YB6]
MLRQELEILRKRVAELESTKAKRQQAEREILEHQKRLNKAEEVAHLGSWEMDIATGESRWSDEFYRICGLEPGSVSPSAEVGLKLIHPDDRVRAIEAVNRAIEAGDNYRMEKRIVRPDSSVRYVQSIGEILSDKEGRPEKLMGSFLDITELKKAEQEREQLIEQLQTALANVKQLKGLLPICAWCKNIRDDQGYWHQVEVYIRDHSDANFTHGICPECSRKVI